ncbi:hypothetical protein N7455_006886 [Penicillium solitum]|uniref:uncharacterized protein n=1 Tax=Penicillium solitum TaxID=60172 RepID=UPI0017F76588|nr:hypothetical protein HAV15_009512 [Penicillium sp. str. \
MTPFFARKRALLLRNLECCITRLPAYPFSDASNTKFVILLTLETPSAWCTDTPQTPPTIPPPLLSLYACLRSNWQHLYGVDAIQIGTNLGAIATTSLFLASRTLLSGFQWAELPTTQWRLELSRWFSEGLALIQQGFVDSATVSENNGVHLPQLSGTEASCKHQIVRNVTGLQNFNMLAIVIVLVLGSIIIVLGLTIDSIVGYVQRRFCGTSEGWVHWTLDGVFQLQRLAYRGAGVRSWRDEDTYIPIVDGRTLPGVDPQTMAFAERDSEEELRLMHNQEAKKTMEVNGR